MQSDEICRRCEQLASFFATAPMKKTFGMHLEFDDEGAAIFEMPYSEKMTHALGDTHGGVIATLLDNAGWFSAASQYDTWINTVELTVRLLEPANKEKLLAKGHVVRAGKQIAVTRMEVTSETGRLIAIGEGTFNVSTLPTQTVFDSSAN